MKDVSWVMVGVDKSLECVRAYRARGHTCLHLDVFAPSSFEVLANLKFHAIVCGADCRGYSSCSQLGVPSSIPREVPRWRDLCVRLAADKHSRHGHVVPFWIENVPNALTQYHHMIEEKCVVLCGLQFGLNVVRHRVFECHFQVARWSPCNHVGSIFCNGALNTLLRPGVKPCCAGNTFTVIGKHHNKEATVTKQLAAMGLSPDWDFAGVCQAVPPLYASWLAGWLCMGIAFT